MMSAEVSVVLLIMAYQLVPTYSLHYLINGMSEVRKGLSSLVVLFHLFLVITNWTGTFATCSLIMLKVLAFCENNSLFFISRLLINQRGMFKVVTSLKAFQTESIACYALMILISCRHSFCSGTGWFLFSQSHLGMLIWKHVLHDCLKKDMAQILPLGLHACNILQIDSRAYN